MKKTILVFGLISGVVSSVFMLATVPFLENLSGNKGYVVGYTGIVLAFLFVYFGIRSYRDNVGGGQITFAKGFGVGICITLISCAFYVLTWEILYFKVLHGFMDNYGAQAIAQMKAAGASAAAIQKKTEEIETLKVQLNNPLFNAAMTFIEPFPVGLVFTLVSAALLRKRERAPETVAA